LIESVYCFINKEIGLFGSVDFFVDTPMPFSYTPHISSLKIEVLVAYNLYSNDEKMIYFSPHNY
jgi:hypothetical protein